MLPSTEDVVCIAQNVLNTMVNMEAVPCDSPQDTSSARRFTGCVQISGAWQGAVVLRTTEDFVREAAVQMLQLQPEEIVEADIQDVLAEITNMIGGNIKSQVPGPSYLSIPSVATGQDFQFSLKGAKILSETPLLCGRELLDVLICESN